MLSIAVGKYDFQPRQPPATLFLLGISDYRTGTRRTRRCPMPHRGSGLEIDALICAPQTFSVCPSKRPAQIRNRSQETFSPALRYRQLMPRPLHSPRPPRYDFALACRDLSAADPKLGRLITRAGPFTMRIASAQSPFEALVESIVYQQLHGKAAATIHRRLLESFGPVLTVEASCTGSHPTAQQILDCPNTQLRAAGLSANKSLALRDLAAKTIDGTVPTLAR